MALYFVDYENVNTNGLNGITGLIENDIVYIFYSENANSLTFGLHRRIKESLAEINYIKVETGTKNALDFQLVTYLGYLIFDNKDLTYYIVSKDNGFDSVIKFWSKRKVNIELVSDMTRKNLQEERKDIIANIEKIIDSNNVKTVMRIIEKYKTKQGINNALVKEYESKKAGEIYKAIKPFIVDKKGRNEQ